MSFQKGSALPQCAFTATFQDQRDDLSQILPAFRDGPSLAIRPRNEGSKMKRGKGER